MSCLHPLPESNSTLSNDSLNYYAQSLTYSLTELKKVFSQKDNLESTRVAAYERLAEISKTMRIIFEKYSFIKSKELLLNASSLVQSVKTYDYETYSAESHSKLLDSINKLYSSFNSSISSYVMEDIITRASVQSMEPRPAVSSNILSHQIPTSQYNTPQEFEVDSIDLPEEKVFAIDSGLDESLTQAKIWSKYVKEIISYIEKRVQVEMDYNRNIAKNAQNLRSSITSQNTNKAFLPFENIYHQFLEKEIENANISLGNFDLLTQNFLAPLIDYRIEFDKQIKKIKEEWSRENKQMTDSVHHMTKCRDFYLTKKQELEKITFFLKSSENMPEWASNDKIEKKRRTSEETTNRTHEAEVNYNKSIVALHSQTVHFKKVKRELTIKIRDMLSILEIKIKEITSHYFETLKDSMTYSPAQIKKAIDDTNKYETGKCYRDFANSLQLVINDNNGNNSACKSLGHHSTSHQYFSSSAQYNPELDSSESDNNSTLHQTYLSKSLNRKDSTPTYLERSNEFSVEQEVNKTFTKSYKKCYGNYKVTSPIEDNFNEFTEKKNRIFGVPLVSLSGNGSVPDIVKQCVEQIEMRGAQINGIYRISGVKSKVENLCQTYESDPASANISNVSPNIIANVLKHFFRELPEPLLTFQLYQDFIKIARKFSNNHTVENGEDIVSNLKKVVSRLPPVHYNTLKYMMKHLRVISNNCAVNNMPPSNLGIVFGPTLLKKDNNVNASASTLFDTNHQCRIIELLIIYSNELFDYSDEKEVCEIENARQNSFNKGEISSLNQDLCLFSKQHQHSNQSLNNEGSFRMCKSATCSSILPKQSKQYPTAIDEARRQFFYDNTSPQLQSGLLQRYKPSNSTLPILKSYNADDSSLSPFSQITTSSASSSSYGLNRIKRLTSSNFNSTSVSTDKPNKIYHKHNELSKSSSDLYSFKNINMTITQSSEDLV